MINNYTNFRLKFVLIGKYILRDQKTITKMNKFSLLLLMIGALHFTSMAQPDRWQQHAVYNMDIDFDVETHRFTGIQKLTLTNNSPDELNKVFYHLYFNAFQPGSMMDLRNQALSDSDQRVQNRIGKLSESEIGYQKINKLRWMANLSISKWSVLSLR